MCTAPIPIKNLYRKNKVEIWNKLPGAKKEILLSTIKDDKLYQLHDSHSDYIYVPCGHCKDCLRARRYNLVQRCEMESIDKYPYFITLTYNKEHMPKYMAPNGKIIQYADRENVKKMFKRIRTHKAINRKFRYIAVSERGTLKGRPHHHILLFIDKYTDDDKWTPYIYEEMLYELFKVEWKVNVSGDKFKPKYESLYTFKRRIRNGQINTTYDCHYIRPHIDDITRNVTQYIFKYIAKPNKHEKILFTQLKATLEGKEFTSTWRKVRSCFTASRFWGTGSDDKEKPNEKVLKHIKMCTEQYTDGFPIYYSPFSTDSCGLAPYYIKKPIFFPEEKFLKYNEYLHKLGYYAYNNDRTPTKVLKDENIHNTLDKEMKWEQLQELSYYDIIDFEELE